MAANGHTAAPEYACKCLNIRLHTHPRQDAPPHEVGFTPVFVGDDGIRVAHTEVTLRSRSKPVPEPNSTPSMFTRYTSLTCLICGTLAYRVLQRVTPDLVNEEGVVLPTDDWVERELLKSNTGWIEVSNQCLDNARIREAEASPMYSALYRVVLPAAPTSLPTSGAEESATAVPKLNGNAEPRVHLPELPPLFHPPPFSPSHPVFTHFSSIAMAESSRLRIEAEASIAQFAEKKAAEVQDAEAGLARGVEQVWTRFREIVQRCEQSTGPGPVGGSLKRRVSGRHAKSSSTGTAVVQGAPASVRVTDFVPVAGPPARSPAPDNRPRPSSALSASLATSGMHFPREQRIRTATSPPTSPVRRSGDSHSSSSSRSRASPARSSIVRVMSPSTASSRTIAVPATIDGEASIREAYRRSMDQSKDIATSFRYVMDLEKHMEAQREETELASQTQPTASASEAATVEAAVPDRGRSPRTQKSAFKQPSRSPKDDSAAPAKQEESKSAGAKGKRKVTFDVEPEVTIIKSEEHLNSESDRANSKSSMQDPIFDMDGEGDNAESTRVNDLPEAAKVQSPAPTPTTDRTRSPRHSRSNSGTPGSLPAALATLRPASLPAVSLVLPNIPPASPDRRIVQERAAPKDPANPASSESEMVQSPLNLMEDEDGTPLGPREAEILRLVAAGTPSHRNAWKKNSKAWQLFLNRRERKSGDTATGGVITEENYPVVDDFDPSPRSPLPDSDPSEEDSYDDQSPGKDPIVAASLPIPIGPLHQRQFGLQPKTSLVDRPGVLVPALQGTSASIRKAFYAERDRERLIDPGALDFTLDDDDDDDVQEDIHSDPEDGGKSRERARKILEARDAVPAAGMWRSLA